MTKIHYNYLPIGEAAKYLGKSVHTLQRWDREGKLVAQRTKSDRRIYSRKQLDKFIRQNYHKNSLQIFTKSLSKKEIATNSEFSHLLKRVKTVLKRPTNANLLLIGKGGVGKMSFVRYLQNNDPDRIYLNVETGLLIDQAENGMDLLIFLRDLMLDAEKMSEKKDKGVVLVIDEFHQILLELLLSLKFEASLLTQLFKSFTNQRVHVIATITPGEYKAFFKRLIKLDPNMDKIFERIEIEEPEKQITVRILHDLAQRYRVLSAIKNPNEFFGKIYDMTKCTSRVAQPRASIFVFDQMIGWHRAYKEPFDEEHLVKICKATIN